MQATLRQTREEGKETINDLFLNISISFSYDHCPFGLPARLKHLSQNIPGHVFF